jgi:hypothetical protein
MDSTLDTRFPDHGNRWTPAKIHVALGASDLGLGAGPEPIPIVEGIAPLFDQKYPWPSRFERATILPSTAHARVPRFEPEVPANIAAYVFWG